MNKITKLLLLVSCISLILLISLIIIPTNVTNTASAEAYTITFNSNGGSVVTPITQEQGTAITAPTPPTKTGFTFAAWYSDSALTQLYTFTTMPAQNITLYAEWGTYGLAYDLINGGTAYEVSKGTATDTSVVIPSTHNGLPVTEIPLNGFYDCQTMISISLPTSLTSIHDTAFANTNIISITIPSNVTYIGNNAFIQNHLVSINVDANNNHYSSEDGILYNYSKTIIECYPMGKLDSSYVIPSSVETIDYFAFDCVKIQDITIPASVLLMLDSFQNCAYLTSINVDSNNPNYMSTNGALFNKSCTILIRYPQDRIGSFTIPSSVTTLNSYSMVNRHLSNIIIPANVINIGDCAFATSTALINITIPATVITIGTQILQACTSLLTATLPFKSPYNATNNSYLSYYFGGQSYLDNLYIPSSLHTVNISSGITTLGNYVFYNCSNLTSITSPSTLTTIGSSVFYGCTGLMSITLPASLTSIGTNILTNCTSLTTVTLPFAAPYNASNNSFLRYYFGGTAYNAGGTIPASLKTVNIVSGATTLGDYAFYGLSGLTSIVKPASVTSIGSQTFRGCSGITTFSYTNVISIGSYSFYSCTSLSTVTLSSSITSLGNYSFYGCTGLTTITIPTSLTSAGTYILSGCSSLVTATLPFVAPYDTTNYSFLRYYFGGTAYNAGGAIPSSLKTVNVSSGITTLGANVFRECNNLTRITIPSTVTSVGTNSMTGCTAITNITVPFSPTYSTTTNSYLRYYFGGTAYNAGLTIPASLTTVNVNTTALGSYAFRDCTMITTVTLPNGTSIGNYAFRNCTGLTSIGLNYVTTIGTYAFYGCTGLTSIALANVTSIGSYAFRSCTGVTWASIGTSITSIGSSAFSGCSNLASVLVFNTTPPSLGGSAFLNCSSNLLIGVRSASVAAYKASWTAYANNIISMGF